MTYVDDGIGKIRLEIQRCELQVLVLATESSEKHKKKYEKILDELAEHFERPGLHLSEDKEEASRFDLYVVVGPPNQDVINQLTKTRELHKLLHFAHKEHKGKHPEIALLEKTNNLVFYDDKEFEQCNLATRAVTRAKHEAFYHKNLAEES